MPCEQCRVLRKRCYTRAVTRQDSEPRGVSQVQRGDVDQQSGSPGDRPETYSDEGPAESISGILEVIAVRLRRMPCYPDPNTMEIRPNCVWNECLILDSSARRGVHDANDQLVGQERTNRIGLIVPRGEHDRGPRAGPIGARSDQDYSGQESEAHASRLQVSYGLRPPKDRSWLEEGTTSRGAIGYAAPTDGRGAGGGGGNDGSNRRRPPCTISGT